ncbi:hypothetical protein [Marinoscillum sp.]|uniref:hypothetical protein n=1 Tax=Marinoscillum sp. TaxID=2024838 RepID=UPI003BA99C5A
MKAIDDHIEKHLPQLLKDPSTDFGDILQYLGISESSESQILNYINRVLDSELNFAGSTLKFTHLHLPCFSSAMMLKILQFISVKFYLKSFRQDGESDECTNCFFRHQLAVIERKLSKNITLGPEKYNRAYAQQKAERKELRKLKKIYKGLIQNDDSDHNLPIPRTLINTLKALTEQFLDTGDDLQWVVRPADTVNVDLHAQELTQTSYVVLNNHLDLDKLDEIQIRKDTYLLDEIENVILFNSDSKSVNKKFNFKNLEYMNQSQETRFRNLLIISFDSGPFRLNLEINRLSRILSNYFHRPDSKGFDSYIISQNEVGQLFKNRGGDSIGVEMIGSESDFYDHFVGSVEDNEGLRELTSIKLRNIYSLCFNEKIKQLILRDLFEDTPNSSIVTAVTASELDLLRPDALYEIRNALEDLLSVVIDLRLAERIQNANADLCIVIPAQILDHKDLFIELKAALGTGKFTTWKKIDPAEKRRVIILEYRDSGFHNFNIYPNLIETKLNNGTRPMGLFLSMFFNKNYRYNEYSYQHYFTERLLDHPFRKEFLKWEELKEVIKSTKPEFGSLDHLWDLDNEYEGSSDTNSVIVEFEGSFCRTYYPTQLLVVKKGIGQHLSTMRAEDLLEMSNGSDCMVQSLESLYEDLNLFKVTEDEEIEIKKLKADYRIPTGQGDTRLWKELLKRKASSSTPDQVYDNLESRINGVNSQMISRNYFENEWLEPQSKSLIPRDKKVFKEICDYLELPVVYFRVMLKKRAREKKLSRISNSKMNKLFTQMIDSGLFDDPPVEATSELWREIASIHDLEEIGINSVNRDIELSAWVDLARPNLYLEKVSSVQTKYS